MINFSYSFEGRGENEVALPLSRSGGCYRIHLSDDGSVDISGDQNGLLYLAEVLIVSALAEVHAGFHLHLPLTGVAAGPDLSGQPELTIFSGTTGIVV